MSVRLVASLLSQTTRSRSRLSQLRLQLSPQLPQTAPTHTMATAIPKTMEGIQIEKIGGVEVLDYRTDLPVPTPKEGEILVKNDFVGINYIDIYTRTGLYTSPKPEILGREGEGTVIATGPGELNFKVGDRVSYMGPSAYAEYTAAPTEKAHVVPPGIEPGVAAAVLLQGLTALTLIREAHAVKKGDWVLVHAAAGGVGLLLCQLLRAVGARTIGTAGTEEKMELARKNGAEFIINYKEEKDLVGKVKALTGGEGVRVVFDSTGKDQFDNDLEVVARKGSVISYGYSSGFVPPFNISRLAAKNIKLMRSTVFQYVATQEEFAHWTRELFDTIIKDKINVRIHKIYPLAEAARAHMDLEGRNTTGKLLLKP